MKPAPLVAILALSSLVGCSLTACQNDPMVSLAEVRKVVRPAGKVVRLTTLLPVGSIRIEPSADNSFAVEAEVRVRESMLDDWQGRTAFEDHIEVNESKGNLTIASAHDSDNGWSIHLTVRAPTGLQVESEVSVGSVRIQADRLPELIVRCKTGSIRVDVASVDGRLELTNKVGSIVAACRKSAPGRGALVETSTGNVELALPPQTNGSFDLSAKVGDVAVAPHYGLAKERRTTAAEASGTVGQGGPRFTLRTSVGKVTLN